MHEKKQFLSPSEAARRLGVSTKALRLYEQRGLLTPLRSDAGWRTYGPSEMAEAGEIAALRALGLSLTQVAAVLKGGLKGERQLLEPALAAHQASLQSRAGELGDTIARVAALRADLARGQGPATGALAALLEPRPAVSLSLELPWPWGGETFELHGLSALNYIIGPLGSGKTRLAQAIAAALPEAKFLPLERVNQDAAGLAAELDQDVALKARVEKTLAWLAEEGATASAALGMLIAALETQSPAVLVIDMVEAGLDQVTQEALMSHLRQRGPEALPLFLMTRSSAILDLAAVGPGEAIILCPANHSPPTQVAPYPGSPGYEAVATCLATPEVRARTEGVIAWRPEAA